MARKVRALSYTLNKENGGWLGQIVLTEDGMFSSVTDWGNISYAWRAYGGPDKDFRDFIISLEVDYFAGCMFQASNHFHTMRQLKGQCKRFAEEILPALQKVLKEEKEAGVEWDGSIPLADGPVQDSWDLLSDGMKAAVLERKKQIEKYGYTDEFYLMNPQWYAANQLEAAAIGMLILDVPS